LKPATNRRLRPFLAASLLALGVTALPAHAQSSFQGTTWSLSYSGSPLADSDPLHQTYRITLGVDTNGYTGGGSFLDQVAIKVSNSVFAASLFDAPGGASSWTLVPGGLNANGCNGSGSGFECVNSQAVLNGGKGVAINAGNGVGVDYSWVFDITVNNGALFTGLGQSSVKARFVNNSGNKVGALVSEPISLITTSPVPEPEAYGLLLAGLGLLGFHLRRQRKQPAA